MNHEAYKEVQLGMVRLRRMIFDVVDRDKLKGNQRARLAVAYQALMKFEFADSKVRLGSGGSDYFPVALYAAGRASDLILEFLVDIDLKVVEQLDEARRLCHEIRAHVPVEDEVPSSVIDGYEHLFEGDRIKNRLGTLTNRLEELERLLANTVSSIPTRIENEIKSSLLGIDQRFDSIRVDIGESKDSLDNAFRVAIESVADKRNELMSLIGEATALHLIKDYASSALEEKRAADRYRFGALSLMSLAFGIFLIASLQSSFDIANYGLVFGKLIFALFLIVPIAYVAREAGKHRAQFQKLRQTALDLGAVSPYLTSLDKPNQDRVKMDIATRIFTPSEVRNDDNGLATNTMELLMKLMDKLELPKKPNAS